MIGKSVLFIAKHKTAFYSLFIILTIATLLLTLTPSDAIDQETIHHYDKVGHIGLFFVWTFMLGFSFIIQKKRRAPLLAIFIAATLFGISIEISQELMSNGRFASLLDIAANMGGSVMAIAALRGIQTHYQSYLEPYLSKNNIKQRNTLDS
ncbi:MAG: hypothetical protein GVY08_04805 [Bacteroidetes bacterium]|jgi:VanZ family protein|nr:hypothetical protein [Bacteroidota bacterium]